MGETIVTIGLGLLFYTMISFFGMMFYALMQDYTGIPPARETVLCYCWIITLPCIIVYVLTTEAWKYLPVFRFWATPKEKIRLLELRESVLNKELELEKEKINRMFIERDTSN